MEQSQRQADIYQEKLCPRNKRYALMDANKKFDLENPLCPNESILLENILQNHPLRFSIAASSSLPWIYLGQFWHTLKEDGSKYKLKFVLGRKELNLTLDYFRTIFYLPRATYNNHERFFPAPIRDVYDKYHNLEDDEMVKSIFNSGKNKAGVGVKILSWMITDEMKLTNHYRMYAAVFRVDVPTTQSQAIESTQGTHRTTSAPRSPNLDVDEGESSAPRKSIVIRLHIPLRRSTSLPPPTPILTTAETDNIILQDTIKLSLAEQKSRNELKAKKIVQKVKEHLIAEEIEKLVEGTENVENVEVDSSTLRKNDNKNDPDTRLEPMSNKESPEVEITAEVQPVNVNKEEEKSIEDDYKLKRREKGKTVEESRNTPSPTTIRSPMIHSTLISLDTKKLQELTVNGPPPSSSTPSSSSPKPKLFVSQHILSLFKPKTGCFKRYKSFFDELQRRYRYLFEHVKTRFMPKKKFHEFAQHLQEVMEESLPKMVDTRVKELTKTQVPIYVIHRLIMERQQSQADMAKMIVDAIQQECENL
ncbi:hypothetical protein Tco_1261386 [Tanacetum coccineum]